MAKSQINKTLLFVGIFTALTSSFMLYILLSYGFALATSLLLAAGIAGFTLVLSLLSHSYAFMVQRRAFDGKKQAADNADTHQQRTVEIDLPLDTAFDLALDALATLDAQDIPLPDDPLLGLTRWVSRKQSLRIREANQHTGTIKARLRSKIMGLPDVTDFSQIEMRLERVDNRTTRIHIESKPNLLIDLYDLGRNLHYVNQLATYLRRESQQTASELRLIEQDTDDAISLDHETQQASDSKTQ